jgi:hypothetical protein
MLERFKDIFAGLETAYGYSTMNGNVTEKGKKEAKSLCAREPVTNALWKRHLDGIEPSIGIFLIRDGNKCKFGCIDIDIYNLDHLEILKKIKEKNLPLIYIKSKSGGAHVYLFTKEFVPASLVREKLKKMAALLGYAKSEIYPKQDYVRPGEKELGSWLNIPYFGSDKTVRYALDENGNKLNLEQFIKLHDEKVLTGKDLIHLNFESNVSVANKDDNDLLKGAPPCLVTLLKDGIPEGTRNDMMYNIGVYLKKRFPENWQSKMYIYNEKFMLPPLVHKEIEDLLGSLNKKEYRYKCKQEPIASFCDSMACVKKEFGVGDDVPAPEITSIQKYPSDPPIYFVCIDGKSVEVDKATLHDPEKFSIECMDQISKPMLPVGKIVWRKTLIKLFGELDELEAPESSKIVNQLKDLLADFINKSPGKELEDLKRGLPFTENGKSQFIFKDFWKYLQRSKAWTLPYQKTMRKLEELFGAKEKNTKIEKKSFRVITMETIYLDKPLVRKEEIKEAPFKS